MGLSEENRALLARAIERGRALMLADPTLARSMPSPIDFAHVVDAPTSAEIVVRAFARYAERPCFGFRRRALERDERGRVVARALPEWDTLTYAEVFSRIVNLATGLVASGTLTTGAMAALVGFSTVDHVVSELGTHYLGAPSVPLAKDVTARELAFVLEECEIEAAFVSVGQLALVAETARKIPSLRTLVVMDLAPGDEAHEEALSAGRATAGPSVRVTTLAELESLGARTATLGPALPRDGDDTLVTLVYTSGSTGAPKGAAFHEGAWLPRWRTLPFMELTTLPMVSMVFLPQNHMGGRNAVANSLRLGGLAYFTHGSDMSTLLGDIRAVRPTYLHLVPRLTEMVHRHFQNEVARRGGSDAATRAVLEEMGRTYWGNRMLLALTASAPTPPPVAAFIKRCFDIPIVDVFAGTEYGQLFVDGRINRENVLAYKLVSVPELGYLVTDRPYPRGELRVKTARAIRGYFKNEAATRALVDDDGFLSTGDVFEERGPDALTWIDRKNNVLKLAQGEFVNVRKLESLFATESRFIEQVYIQGDAKRAYLVGVLVPDRRAIAAEGDGPPDEASVRALLRAELERIAAAHELQPYEALRDFILEETPFSRENGLLTSLDKPARPALKARYGPAIEALYDALDQAAARAASPSGADDGDLPIAARVTRRAAAVLGLAESAVAPSRTFRHLGGDSLAAANLCAVLDRDLGVKLSAGFVLGPSTSLDDLAAAIASAGPSGFTRVHGAGATRLRARDLAVDRFFPGWSAEVGPRARRPTRTEHVLLTGATGFLGRFLALALLERTAHAGGTVTCLVRARSDEAARARLDEVYGRGSPLQARFRALAAGRLRVVAGDLSRRDLGLPPLAMRALETDVDTIVHAAAHVNHALSYADLFDENVGATAALLALALRGREKRFDFVSTNTVSLALAEDGVVPRETDDTRARGDGWPIAAAGHADGYRASKWASEVLAQDAAERFGLHVNVFRVSLILPPLAEDARAVIHPEDFLTRLVLSLAMTGIAPGSFYRSEEGATPHLDGLPVDFIADAIAAVADEDGAGEERYRVHHVNNVHWNDGVSLDTVVDALAARGFSIARIDDHATWFARFEAALAALDPARRAASSFAIRAQWREPIATARRRVDASRFRARVKSTLPHGFSDIPSVDAAYFERFIDALRAAGLLDLSGDR